MFTRFARLRHVALLGAIVLAAPLLAGPTRAAAIGPLHNQASTERLASAPSAIGLDSILFSTQSGADAPAATSFRFGPREIFASVNYRGAAPGSAFKYIFRFGATDVNFGEVATPTQDGRGEIRLARQDADYLMLGTFELVVTGLDGNEFGRASFSIFDDESDDNGDDGDNDNDDNVNDNGGNDNGDNGNDNGDHSNDDGNNGNDNS